MRSVTCETFWDQDCYADVESVNLAGAQKRPALKTRPLRAHAQRAGF